MCEVFTHTLPAATTSPARAREWVTTLLRARLSDSEAIEATELVISELVTNALRHSGCATSLGTRPEHVILLRLFVAARRIRIDVTDPGAAPESDTRPEAGPMIRTPEAGTEHGRGLALVDAVSERLSWCLDHRGCTVTAQVTHSPVCPPDPMAIHQEALLRVSP